MDEQFLAELERIVGPDGIVRDDAELATYESDGLAKMRSRPGAAVLPGSAEEVRQSSCGRAMKRACRSWRAARAPACRAARCPVPTGC